MTDRFGGLGAADIRDRVGTMRQLGRAELFEFAEGPERGSRVVRISSIDGFDLEVFPDRGLDFGAVSWRGIPLAWLSAAGPMAPGMLDSGSPAWVRGFGGGLLTTCGLDQFGHASDEGGEALPMHGRAHTLAASGVRVWSEAVGEQWQLGTSGVIRQSSAFHENLRLERRITTSLGSGVLTINDTVTNDALEPWPHMILYHLNLGWPLLDDASVLSLHVDGAPAGGAHHGVDALDAAAEAGIAEWGAMDGPRAGRTESLFRHRLPSPASVTARVESPRAGIAFELEWNSAELGHMFEWKMLGAGNYALGLEPANSSEIFGRASARAADALVVLRPGESRSYELVLRVTPLG